MKLYHFPLILIILFATCNVIHAQDLKYLEVVGTVESNMTPLVGAKVELIEGSSVVQTIITKGECEFKFRLELNKKFVVRVSKDEYIAKKIEFDTKLPDGATFYVNPIFAVNLFKGCPGVNTEILKKPIDIIRYSKTERNFISDEGHYNQMMTGLQRLAADVDKCWQDKYQEHIDNAKELAEQNKFDEAKASLEAAKEIFPADRMVKREMDALARKKKSVEENERLYEQYVYTADKALAEGNTSLAKQKYEEAKELRPGDTSLDAKLAAVLEKEKELASIAQVESNYQSLLTQASNAEAAKNYPLAKELLEKAAEVKPQEDVYISRKISALEPLIRKQQEEEKRREENTKAYEAAVAAGSAAMQQGNLEQALAEYRKAQTYDATKSETLKKIKEIEKLIAQKKAADLAAQKAELDKNYNEAVAEGNSMLEQNKFDEAIAAFNRALTLKPNEPQASRLIAKAKNEQTEFNEKKLAEISVAYDKAMAKGDQAKLAKEFQQAKEAYQEALKLKPEDPYVTKKLAEVDKLIENEAIIQKELVEKRNKYNEIIKEADVLYADQSYESAKNKYLEADNLIPEEIYPNNQITKIENIIKKRDIETQFKNFISQADHFVEQNNFDDAIAILKEAKVLVPESPVPDKKINEISELKNKIRAEEIATKFNGLIADADRLVSEQKFDEAIKVCKQAKLVKPESTIPDKKINEISKLKNELLTQEIETKFNDLLTQADALVEQQKFEEAKAVLKQAKVVKPESPVPDEKINQISNIKNKLLADERDARFNQLVSEAEGKAGQQDFDGAITLLKEAKTVKPESNLPDKKINEYKELQSKLIKDDIEKRYNELITQAKTLIEQKKFDEAIAALKQAQTVIPESKEPTRMINEIQTIKNQLAKADIEKRYQEAIDQGDANLKQSKLDEAAAAYKLALTIIADEEYPQKKLNEISRLRSEMSLNKIKEQYTEWISKGDNAFTGKDYQNAISFYKNASSVLPDELYPQQKINEINAIISKEKQDAELAREKEERYNDAIKLADKYFNEENFPLARSQYNLALSLKAGEAYPTGQLQKIAQRESEIAELQKQKEELNRNYQLAVNEGDEYYKQRKYQEAIGKYEAALQLKPNEVHPQDQITRINNIMAQQNAKLEQLKKLSEKYNALISQGDDLYKKHMYKQAKQQFSEALKIKPQENYPRAMITKIDETLKLVAKAKTGSSATTAKSGSESTEGTIASNVFKSTSEKERYYKQLKEKYEVGVTKEVYKDKTKTTNRFVIIRDGKVSEFREVRYSWGGAEFTYNGRPITSQYFSSQTKLRSGEQMHTK
ncbi:MAG: tetratricopeptide repeat protein [Bacteroidales bacterium]|nr:tetratricopeptide repeat protein [Bacteroidales bacterium]